MKFFVLSLSFVAVFASCTKSDNFNSKKISEKSGGTFSFPGTNEIKTLLPSAITMESEGVVVSQIHEGLVRLNSKTLEVCPGLAYKWERSADGKLLTFHLNTNAKFQNDACYKSGIAPKVTAKDVKFSFELLCTKGDNSFQYEMLFKNRLAGADEFFNSKAKQISGIKIINDSTLSLELVKPTLSFFKLLAHPAACIINEIAYSKYGIQLKNGAGPFMYSSTSTNEKVVLVKNPTYFGVDSLGYALPYLDTVSVLFLNSIEDGLTLFENNKLDLVNTIPSLRVKDIIENNIKEFASSPPKTILKREPEMITQYYLFNTTIAPYNNVKVRQAINYAIDKEKLVDQILQGQAIGAAIYGITPNTFKNYSIKNIKGYNLDIAKAKQLLAEAGYPNGKGFPEVRLLINSGNTRNSTIAAEIQKQLQQNLNINISFESLSNKLKYELQTTGKSDIYRDAWVADYPSPESFLSLFVSDGVPDDNNETSYPNTSRYKNNVYDMYFKKGREAITIDTSYAYFLKAEQQLINDAPLIPLWYEGSYRLLASKVKNFELNAMRCYDLRQTYILK